MKSRITAITIFLGITLLTGFIANKTKSKPTVDLSKIMLPDGFKIDVFAEEVVNARTMVRTPNGTIFVGTRGAGNVYALRDNDGDFKVDEQFLIDRKLNMPNGVTFKDGSLYVAEYNRILRYDDIEKDLANPPEPVVVTDNYPSKKHHGWKYIEFGPDGKLYVPVGAPCNICESEDEIFNTITRINPDGSNREIVHRGIRNTVGFTWHPETKELWFTDNGRDWMGDDMPSCELNRATKDGLHFGYPFCHQGDVPDDKLAGNRTCDEFVPPVVKIGPHTAPLGLIFYTGQQFPASFTNKAIIAEHGSWNRSEPIGYQLSMVDVSQPNPTKEVFASGWLEDGESWGRPVDLEPMPDGSVLVSDDFADVIYRISYVGK
ncbi:MAG: PQQ-dependent sugar dehydrogenase [Bacteroidota bacterium]